MTTFDYKPCKYARIVDSIFPYKFLYIACVVCAILVFIGVIFSMIGLNPIIPSIPIIIFIVIVLVKLSANRIEYFRATRYCKKNNITIDEFNRLFIESTTTIK